MSAGKGSSPRNCFSQQYRDNYDRVFRNPVTQSAYTDPYWNQCACGTATRSKRKLCPQCRNRKGIPLNPPDHPWRKPAQQ